MRFIDFGKRTLIMGVINATPDSFYAGSRVVDVEKAVDRALKFIEEGADIIDIGGESSRPGSKDITAEEEMKRVIPVVEKLREKRDVLISVDTWKPEVASRAIGAGADIINDITGLRFDDRIAEIVAEAGVYIVLMHMRGRPYNMVRRANYTNVVAEVSKELDVSIEKALNKGVNRNKIIIDPGIGFAKRPFHNVLLIKHIDVLKEKGFPVLIGLSRKSFLGFYTGLPTDMRLVPTVAANAISIYNGADIIRVHDVREAYQTVRIVDAIKEF